MSATLGPCFGRVEYRAANPDEASAFYADVLSLDRAAHTLGRAGEPWLYITRLPEQAVARGAPPHWLSHVGVDDVEAAAQRLVALGATRLGPTATDPDGVARAVLRDPSGAVMCVGSARDPSPAVAWRVLRTPDVEVGFRFYVDAFGWPRGETYDTGLLDGPLFAFSTRGGASEGAVLSNALSPHVHPQWLHFFVVPDLDAALALVAARGGSSQATHSLPGGARVAGCEDPHGGAFGLWEGERWP